MGNQTKLRSGYTTGTCAAAATRAAIERLLGNDVTEVTITLPNGEQVRIPVAFAKIEGTTAKAGVIKDAGDDPDVTNNMCIQSEVQLHTGGNQEIVITGGEGIGKVTKPGLSVPVGEYAINPVPRQMIMQQAQELLSSGMGATITLSAPEGAKIANKTLNPKLGIIGGISILGTTGIVRPMSEEAYLDSLIPQIHQAIAMGQSVIALTPGGMGEKKLLSLGVNSDAIVQTSNFIGAMIKECAKHEQIRGILLFGHIGKLIKVSAGIFHTHSKVADGRRETLAAHVALMEAPVQAIRDIMALNTIDAGKDIVEQYGLQQVYTSLATAASQRVIDLIEEVRYHNEAESLPQISVGTVMYALDGQILGYDLEAADLGKELGWRL
ncbi:cobalt-precorrin-5B (C(1))-methyltransferase CbiD [Desulfuribacillus alkaliarsenatis]|uniref:Cobalt-precorrin-5B C(1)-methyltransferase n=1 Tax=Desulfuribacillus alkaliarsenatis TaxID=766136 RepID=A0A1E5G4J1_9FIRM|nr:cobalt-precorrin-5B (C(1))-methyltransferase CbiD [Desulfuribacillus alkaliarsenatis]OEF97998.1 cobalamin biosynthesis protein CbiD [Desulfuribacillus alkaliarsenatis]